MRLNAINKMWSNSRFSCRWNVPSFSEQVGDSEAKAQGQEVNQMATYIMECGGIDRIERLQMHENNNIYNKVSFEV